MPRQRPEKTPRPRHTTEPPGKQVEFLRTLAEGERRMHIVEEYRLRREIARNQATRREEPEVWRRLEAARLERNRDCAELNRLLRAAGCRPVDLEPSLGQKLKKLQRLAARVRAETATFREAK